MCYREKYKKRFGIKFNNDYEVHHIDFDRSNNEIENLILLPRDLHKKLHKIHSEYGLYMNENLSKFPFSNQLSCSMTASILRKYAQIYEELAFWACCKDNEINGIGLRPYNYDRFRE